MSQEPLLIVKEANYYHATELDSATNQVARRGRLLDLGERKNDFSTQFALRWSEPWPAADPIPSLLFFIYALV